MKLSDFIIKFGKNKTDEHLTKMLIAPQDEFYIFHDPNLNINLSLWVLKGSRTIFLTHWCIDFSPVILTEDIFLILEQERNYQDKNVVFALTHMRRVMKPFILKENLDETLSIKEEPKQKVRKI